MTKEEINSLFEISEPFELPYKLLEKLLNDEKRQKLIDDFLKYDEDLSHDILRDYFQENNSNRSELKQDYTPDCICELLSQLVPETQYIIDCCAGTGSLTIGMNKEIYFQCEELSNMSIPVLLFNLSVRKINATVLEKNIITRQINKIYKVDDGRVTEQEQYVEIKPDVIISNPPYSISWDRIYDDRFLGYELPPKLKADYVFVLDIISRLSEKGQAFIILPHGVLFRGNQEKTIRKMLILNNLIDCIIGLPEKLFLNTQIPVVIMVFNREKKDTSLLFIDASKEYVKEKKNNNMTLEQINKIASVYRHRMEVDKLSHIASLDEIKNNDFNLNIPRYVDTYEEEQTINLNSVCREIREIDEEIKKCSNELVNMMKEMKCDDEEQTKKYLSDISPMLEALGGTE